MKGEKRPKAAERRKSKSHVYTDHDPRHLAKIPEDWEVAQGGLEKRVGKVGQDSINYANLIGVPSSGSSSDFWQQVQQLGQDAMKLMGKEEPKYARRKAQAMNDEYAQDIKAIEEGDTTANTGEVLPGIFLDDYETQDWGLEQIESACNTLLEEIEHSNPNSDHQNLGLKMLLKLMDRHAAATGYVQRNMEDIVNKSMPGLLKRKISPTAFQLAPLLAALAPRLGEDMSKLNIVMRVTKFMTYEMNLAARMMQHRIRLKLQRRMEASMGISYPRDVLVRKQLMVNMQSDHLNFKWRAMHQDPMGGVLSEETATFYLQLLAALTSKGRGEFASRFYRNDRLILVQSSGLIPLSVYMANFAHEGKCLAAKVLLNVSQEKTLLLPLLEAEIASRLVMLLDKTNNKTAEGVEIACLILEILDSIANIAQKFIDINVADSGAVRAEETGSVVSQATMRSANSIADPISEEELLNVHSRQLLDKAIHKHLVSPHLYQVLVGLLRWGLDSRVFLGTVMTLHKLCCTVGYYACLEEIMAYAGQGLAMLVEGLQTQEEDYVPVACMTLLVQLASREEGRMGLTKSGAIEMLSPLCCSPTGAHTRVSLLALSCIQALARKGHCPSIRPSQLALDASISTLISRLYEEMYDMLVCKSPQEARSSVAYLVSEGVIPNFEAWLLRPDRPAHYFDLPKVQTYLGAIILHRLCIDDKACELLFAQPGIRFLCYTIQTNYTVLAEGEFRKLSSRNRTLFFQSTQAACRALGCMCLIDSLLLPHAKETVFDELSGTNALDEVSRLLVIPSINEAFAYADYVQNATAAAVLVSALAPVPVSEQNVTNFHETRETEKESTKACLPRLKRLIKQCGEKLVNLIQLTESVELLKSTCMALSKLSSTNETCHDLIGKGIIKAIGRLVPKGRPMMSSVLEQTHERGQPMVVDEFQADDNLRKLASLPSSFFRLLASLARLPEGQKSLLGLGLLKRSLERFNIRPSMQDVLKNHATQSEIALFLARMANTFDMESGSANDYILTEKYDCIPCLITLLREGKTFRGKYNALFALAELSSDTVRAVPTIVSSEALVPVFRVLKDANAPQALIRQALNLVRNVVHYPDRKYHTELLEKYRAREALTRIGSNIALEREFGGVSDRESLGDIARDCLELLTMGRGLKAEYSSSISQKGAHSSYTEDLDPEVSQSNNLESKTHPSPEKKQVPFPKQLGDIPPKKAQSAPAANGSYRDCGVTKCGTLRSKEPHGNPFLPTIDTNKIAAGYDMEDESVYDSNRKTSVGNLSARDPLFRKEVRRRKQIYSIGRFENSEMEQVAPAERYRGTTSSSTTRRRKQAASRRNKSRPTRSVSRNEYGRQSSRSPNNQQDPMEEVELKTRTTVVNLKECPALALTRPPPRKQGSSAKGSSSTQIENASSELLMDSETLGTKSSEEFVRFSRPQTDQSHVPKSAPVVSATKKRSTSQHAGGFKVKGYLLDPTFHEDLTFLSSRNKIKPLKEQLKMLESHSGNVAEDSLIDGDNELEKFVHTADFLGQRVQIESLRSPVLRPSSPLTYRNVEGAIFKDLKHKNKTIAF